MNDSVRKQETNKLIDCNLSLLLRVAFCARARRGWQRWGAL